VSELDDLRESLNASRVVLRGTIKTLRTTLQFLADLEERIDALANAQPHEEAQREHTGHDGGCDDGRIVIPEVFSWYVNSGR
jgi:hypothetical protein